MPIDGMGAAAGLIRDWIEGAIYFAVGVVAVSCVGFGLWFLLLR